MSDNTAKILNYLKEMNGENVTAKDIAEALDLDVRVVNGAVTSGLQKKELAERIPATIEVQNEDGATVTKEVKFIKLTEAGMAFDPTATA